MTEYKTILLILLIGLSACNGQNPVKNEISPVQENVEQQTGTTPLKVEGRVFVSDTVRRIIDELDLCQYSEHLNMLDNYSCYDKDMSNIQLIKKGDHNYNNFIFEAPGGSAGGTILIYTKHNGQYKIVQEDMGCVSDILETTTNGYYDLVIWHRAHKPTGEDILYKWNGRKYDSIKELKK
jgi:hypothetical protein